MRKATRWMPATILGVGCLLTLGIDRQQAVPLAQPLDTLPRSIAGFKSIDVVIGKEEQRVAGMSSYVMRQFYVDSTAEFSVYVGYYEQQAQGKTIHSPKNCLPGAGWEVLNVGYAAVPTAGGPIRVNRYELAREGEQALVYYWYQGRGRVQANEYAVKWDLLRDAALRGRTEEALVRIVVYLDDDTDEAGALTLATTVAQQLIPEVQGVLPS